MEPEVPVVYRLIWNGWWKESEHGEAIQDE